MKSIRVSENEEQLLKFDSSIWRGIQPTIIDMFPAPLAIVNDRSPYMAKAQNNQHGKIQSVSVRSLHNSKSIAIRASWHVEVPKSTIDDLDQFVDGFAILFPVSPRAKAITMGSHEDPANAWYWKANRKSPFDVVSYGFGRTQRRDPGASNLVVAANYDGGYWDVIFRRPLGINLNSDYVQFSPGNVSGIAFSAWQGVNNERSGLKSFSGEFIRFDIEK